MTKFQVSSISLVLALSLGRTSAAGCYPGYTPGNAYSMGASVSQSVSTTTALSWVACTVGAGCSTGWTQVGGVTTTATFNYVCSSTYWCSNVGYAPGGIYSDLAWTKDAASCSGVAPAVTAAPTTLAPTPVSWSGVGCPNAYATGGAYVGGSLVAVGTIVYQCKTGAASGWCPLAGYVPGTGTAWQEAWSLMGSCTGTIAPTTTSPTATQPGCPAAWVSGVKYVSGALVSAGGIIFRCNADPMSLFCGQAGYEPNKSGYGDAYKLAWTTIGNCSGTVAPSTAAPSTTAVYTFPGVCPPEYTSSGAYVAGSRVRKITTAGHKVYECKAFPYSGYCYLPGYEPGTTYGHMGWTDIGLCDITATYSPTSSPTFSPTASPTAPPSSTPTDAPTVSPTVAPTATPTATPTVSPTDAPTAIPTAAPTAIPQ